MRQLLPFLIGGLVRPDADVVGLLLQFDPFPHAEAPGHIAWELKPARPVQRRVLACVQCCLAALVGGAVWVTVPSGVLLALIAPGFAAGGHGWVYAIGIATAAAAMTASVPLRNTPLLALGALTMFGYLTAVAARYLHQSLGVPSALAITGVLIIGLAVVSARLTHAAHRPKPSESGAEEPSQAAHAPEPMEPGTEVLSSHRDRPRAS